MMRMMMGRSCRGQGDGGQDGHQAAWKRMPSKAETCTADEVIHALMAITAMIEGVSIDQYRTGKQFG